jgi:hypothetical protein
MNIIYAFIGVIRSNMGLLLLNIKENNESSLTTSYTLKGEAR